jgi:hypothetical protein
VGSVGADGNAVRVGHTGHDHGDLAGAGIVFQYTPSRVSRGGDHLVLRPSVRGAA